MRPHIKTSLAPGSRVVTDYLERAGLLPYLERLGFNVAAYGCTTCIGNAGDLTPELNTAIGEERTRLRCRAVRQPQLRGAHSPQPEGQLPRQPAAGRRLCAGRLGAHRPHPGAPRRGPGRPAGLSARLWPSPEEIGAQLVAASDPASYRRLYADFADGNPMWSAIAGARGDVYDWPASTYIARPPFFAGYSPTPTRPGADPRRAGARHPRRLGDHRPHLPRRLDPGQFPGRPVAAGRGRTPGRLQFLRRPARSSRGDDARHLRQRPHPQPAAAARCRRKAPGGWLDALFRSPGDVGRRRRGDAHLRRGHALPGGAARRP